MQRYRAASVPFVTVLLAQIILSACTTWRPTTTPLPTLLAKEKPHILRLTLTNGNTMTVQYPIIRGDSLLGGPHRSTDRTRGESLPSAAATATPILALGDVTGIAVRHTNVGGTLGLVALGAATGVLIILLHDCAGGCGGFGN